MGMEVDFMFGRVRFVPKSITLGEGEDKCGSISISKHSLATEYVDGACRDSYMSVKLSGLASVS